MEEIYLKKFLNYLIKKIWIIIISVFAFGVGGYLYCNLNQKTMYKSESKLMVVTQNINESDFKSSSINENVVRTYLEIIKSKKVLNKVIEELNLDLTYNKLYDIVSINMAEKTGIINVSVVDSKSENINSITNKIIEVFTDYINEVIEENNNKIIIVDEAKDYKEYSNLSYVKIIFTAALIGFVIGSLIIYLKFYFNPTVNKS